MGSENPALNTLIYSSIFNFPLSKKEIWNNLISEKKISRSKFNVYLSDSRIKLDKQTKLYYLNKSTKLDLRNTKYLESERKIKLAEKAILPLQAISTISLIGISGSVAVLDAEKNDDIDIFLICKRGTVWLTRLLLIAYLKSKGLYRSKDAKTYKDKVCLNMIIDNYSMRIPIKKRNIYFAKEIVQLLPIFERENTYYKLLQENKWIWNFLPNFKKKKTTEIVLVTNSTSFVIKILLFLKGEFLSRLLQKAYMRGKKSEEIITDNILAFHPTSYEKQIITKFSELFKKYY